jgi:sulfite exporter TauE/SafE
VFDKILRIFSGILMIMAGLMIGNWSSKIQLLEKFGAKLWYKIQPLTQHFLPIHDLKSAFFTGVFWGALPCGLVYSALSFAIFSGSLAEGALIMFSFGLGTLPALLVMATFSASLARFIKQTIVQKFSGLFIIILGLMAVIMPLISLIKSH